jgi:hypothetical protein
MQQLRALIAHCVETAWCYAAAAELRPAETALLDGLQLLSDPAHSSEGNCLDVGPDATGRYPQTASARSVAADPSLDTIVPTDLHPRIHVRPTLPSRQH